MPDVTIPTFDPPIVTVMDLKDVVPAVGVKRFHEAVILFQHNIHEWGIGAVEQSLQHNEIRFALQHHAVVLPRHFACDVLFQHGNFHARHSTLTRTVSFSPTLGGSSR
ncbi:MAG: hypothetical protein MZV64_19465 [Ignavibacteriales bacterium]|nr:hypothetical protein [Ignavibacteriales bacterium]